MKERIVLLIAILTLVKVNAEEIIYADPSTLRQSIEKATAYHKDPITIKLTPGIYRFSREDAIVRKYYASNTCSEKECADPQKHIALLLHSLENVTIDGQESTILLDGEMTSFVIDSCTNILFKDLKIDNIAPTMVEMEVIEDGKDYMRCRVHHDSRYRIVDGKLEWYGKGWAFQQGIAQMYDPKKEITWRSWSPTSNLIEAKEESAGLLHLRYSNKPEVAVGTIFQIRDGIRDEVGGFVTCSKNIVFENIDFHYLGNFSLLGQVSENISILHCNFSPKQGSGRTNSCFADMLHFSGCKGLIDVENCYFSGAHDDPINVHGTHLQISDIVDNRTIRLRYMHPQTYGFQSYFPGDTIEIVNPATLLASLARKIESSKMISPREIEITITEPLNEEIVNSENKWVVENTTWTPKVIVANNYFCRIPTRGILVSTRKKVLIEHNTFYGTQMSGVLIGDDGRSWFESGPVRDVTIRKNTFLKCGSPVIFICPENQEKKSAVHKNITIENNRFEMTSSSAVAVSASSVDGLKIDNNIIIYPSEVNDKHIILDHCDNVVSNGNRIIPYEEPVSLPE